MRSADNSVHGVDNSGQGPSPAARSRFASVESTPGPLSREPSSNYAETASPGRDFLMSNMDSLNMKLGKPQPKCAKCKERDKAQKQMLELVKGGVEGKVGGFVASCFCCVSEFSIKALARKNMEKATCRFCKGRLVKGKDEQVAPTTTLKPVAQEDLFRGLQERAVARVLPSVPQLSLPPVGGGAHPSGAVTVR